MVLAPFTLHWINPLSTLQSASLPCCKKRNYGNGPVHITLTFQPFNLKQNTSLPCCIGGITVLAPFTLYYIHPLSTLKCLFTLPYRWNYGNGPIHIILYKPPYSLLPSKQNIPLPCCTGGIMALASVTLHWINPLSIFQPLTTSSNEKFQKEG